jgi:hypothetical protein
LLPSKGLGVDLSAAFIFDYPTIGDIRYAFGRQDTEPSKDETAELLSSNENEDSLSPTSEEDVTAISAPESRSSFSSSSSDSGLVEVEKEPSTPALEGAKNDTSPLRSVRITLFQGRRTPSKTPLYMMADGTDSFSSYIHPRPFKSKQAVYGADSPYFRCPSRMSSKVSIEGVGKLVLDALIKAHGAGPFLIGGYSAGCLVSFEVSRQLAAAGRKVYGLLLIDMCCPRLRRINQRTLLAEDEFSYDVFEAAVNRDGLWRSLSSSRDHFHAFFVAMNEYTPAPMTAAEPPAKMAVIWAERGLVNRVADDPALMQKLEGQAVPTKPYLGFMEDPKLGTFCVPHSRQGRGGKSRP